jgi:periplasmic glucans biosynthesis protein
MARGTIRHPVIGRQMLNPQAASRAGGRVQRVVRSRLLLLLMAVGLWLPVRAGESGAPIATTPAESEFSFAALRERARARALAEYRPEPNRLPDFLKKLSYDDYQVIRFRPETGPWNGVSARFTLQFFHLGFLYQDPVAVHLVEGGHAHDFHFSPDQFDYGRNKFPKPAPADLQFAGLRVLYPLNSPGKQDEVAAFLGATYYRLIGVGQRYGASSRGLAIDTAEPTGEEFPHFTEFWIERPPQPSGDLQLFALLDSPRASGAYRFTLKPGEVTVAEVEASLFLRKGIKKLGLAPLTSMFLMGASRARLIPDFRPQVHDSDGLLIQTTTGEWLWRPLANPSKAFHLSRWATDNPKGFGLIQRDRTFHDYEDLVARFDVRPSLWVAPRGDWGAGVVELVEIPTVNEWNDNIVAYWIPKQPLAIGQEFHWSYSLGACLTDPDRAELLTVRSTRLAAAHEEKPPRFVIDFVGGASSTVPVEANLQCSVGGIRNLVVQRNEMTSGWRVVFDYLPQGQQEANLRLFLHSGERAMSETWVYNWSPSTGMEGE